MDKDNFTKKLGQYIKETRESLNLSQNDVADMMNNNSQNISAYESGKRNPGTYWIHRLCEALKIDPVDFYSKFYNSYNESGKEETKNH